jgi:hypothetical protein
MLAAEYVKIPFTVPSGGTGLCADKAKPDTLFGCSGYRQRAQPIQGSRQSRKGAGKSRGRREDSPRVRDAASSILHCLWPRFVLLPCFRTLPPSLRFHVPHAAPDPVKQVERAISSLTRKCHPFPAMLIRDLCTRVGVVGWATC